MNSPQELIKMVRSYGAKLKPLDSNQLKVINGESLPPDLIERLRANKQAIIQHLEHSFFSSAVERAINGYHWLLEHKQQQYRRKYIPVSDVCIEVQAWRQTIADVIGLNPCEVQAIESYLINQGELIYYHSEQYIMHKSELDNEDNLLPDNATGQAFNAWLNAGRYFLNS
jgi:hypothetical protein